MSIYIKKVLNSMISFKLNLNWHCSFVEEEKDHQNSKGERDLSSAKSGQKKLTTCGTVQPNDLPINHWSDWLWCKYGLNKTWCGRCFGNIYLILLPFTKECGNPLSAWINQDLHFVMAYLRCSENTKTVVLVNHYLPCKANNDLQ